MPGRHQNYSQMMPEINLSQLSHLHHSVSIADTIESQLSTIKKTAKWSKR